MRIVNLRDAIILNLLRDENRSEQEIGTRLGMQKSMTKQTLLVLKNSGLIEKRRTRGKEFYAITDYGKDAIGRMYKKLNLTM